MKVSKSLEKPTRIMGMRMQELGLYVSLLISLISLTSIARSIVPVPRFVYILILLVLLASWLVLRWGESKKHPSFLLSIISWVFLQPKAILHVKVRHREKNGQLRRGVSRL